MSTSSILEIISLIDLTSLGNTDSEKTIENLIQKGNREINKTKVAAICVFPNFGEFAKSIANVDVAVVAGCFPSGQTFLEAKIAEYEAIQKLPVDEVDIVINRGMIHSENYEDCSREIKAARKIFTDKKLKVILESGELNEEQLKKSAQIAIEMGADFIKTSTGKTTVGATEAAAKIMCEEIARHYKKTNQKVGFKASGGIRSYEDAQNYYRIVKEILGNDWLNKELFRIGASSLYDNLIKELNL